MGDAKVSGHATVSGESVVTGKAWLKGYFKMTQGTVDSGIHSAPTPQWAKDKEKAEQKALAEKKVQENKKAMLEKEKALMSDLKWELKKFQRRMKTGYLGKDLSRGVSEVVEWSAGDIKPPCGFYLSKSLREKALPGECKKTKRVPKFGGYREVPDCKPTTESLGEMFIDLKSFTAFTTQDHFTKNNYVMLNGQKFYFSKERYGKEFISDLKEYRNKYCMP